MRKTILCCLPVLSAALCACTDKEPADGLAGKLEGRWKLAEIYNSKSEHWSKPALTATLIFGDNDSACIESDLFSFRVPYELSGNHILSSYEGMPLKISVTEITDTGCIIEAMSVKVKLRKEAPANQ